MSERRGCCGSWNSWQEFAPTREDGCLLWPLCCESRLPFSRPPRQILAVGARPDTGELWDAGPLIFPLLLLHLTEGSQRTQTGMAHMCCLPSSSHPPPTEQRGSKALAGEREGRGFTSVAAETPLSPSRAPWPEPSLPLHPVGRGGHRGRATALWNRFRMEDLRFNAAVFFGSTTVFQVTSYACLPFYKTGEKSC